MTHASRFRLVFEVTNCINFCQFCIIREMEMVATVFHTLQPFSLGLFLQNSLAAVNTDVPIAVCMCVMD